MVRVLLLGCLCLTFWCCGGQAVVTQQSQAFREIDSTFFGLHIHQVSNRTPFPNVKFGAFRTHDAGGTTWCHLQPEPNRWNFERLDSIVSMMRARGVEVLLTLGQTPRWAAREPNAPSPYGEPMLGAPSPPRDLRDWQHYVETVVRRYQGQIEAYEIWNEPNSPHFWVGTPEEMAELTRIAADTIRRIDPNAIVVSPPASSAEGLPWFEQFLAAGGGRPVDVVAYHMYLLDTDLPEATDRFANYVRHLMRKHGLAEKPLWDTESFIGKANRVSYEGELAAGLLARAFLVHAASGIDRFYWYAWDNAEYPGIQLLSPAVDQPTLAGQAMDRIQDWLTGKTIRSVTKAGGLWSVDIADRAGTVERILWREGTDATSPIPTPTQGVQAETITGKKLQPVNGLIEIGPIPVRLRP